MKTSGDPGGLPFLTAEWRYLAMLNYDVKPDVLARYVPPGTVLDVWQGRTFVSLVGFLFLNTRVSRIPVPFHRNFEEINLRFYVRRLSSEGWRRGVVFVKEIVPRWAIATVARLVYGENYVSLPTHHAFLPGPPAGAQATSVGYSWRFGGQWHELRVDLGGQPAYPSSESEEAFIAEHYWGYTTRRDGRGQEYRVAHPPWRVWRASAAELHCDVAGLYGPEFAAALATSPSSAFVAEGSPVTVYRGQALD